MRISRPPAPRSPRGDVWKRDLQRVRNDEALSDDAPKPSIQSRSFLMSVILGINAYHGDAGACLFVGDTIVGAVEEERLNRIKHWSGLPVQAVKWCLQEAGITLADVDHIAINRDPNANLAQKIIYSLTRFPNLAMVRDRLTNRKQLGTVRHRLEEALSTTAPKATFHNIEHHLAHMASAYYASPYDDAVVLSVDAFGDFCSTAVGSGRGGALTIDKRVSFPHSLGIFYTAMTQYLGFPHYGDEYKVMGLAPYGAPAYVAEFKNLVDVTADGLFKLDLRYFLHQRGAVSYQWNDCAPLLGRVFSPAIEGLFGNARREGEALDQKHKDIARSIQVTYENIFFHMINSYVADKPARNIAIAGGCGYNSVANGKVTTNTPIENVYVQAAAGDSGGALGAAYVVWHRLNPGRRGPRMEHAYLGPRFDEGTLRKAIETFFAAGLPAGISVKYGLAESELLPWVARNVAEGRVVGWFQGGAEWGPRALGNRSIVCDPRRSDMKDILNLKIKRRESFRPFAPSILREDVGEWFELEGEVPFMMQVYPVRRDKREQIPAVTHVDGSGRLQTVTEKLNGRYYRLIREFKKLTGVPCVLNTSFNENEPIVCEPREALDCFARTNMDMLVLGSHVVLRA
jgi:carbamoyltransferase